MNHRATSDFITISMKDIPNTMVDIDQGMIIPLSCQEILSLDEQSRPAIIRVRAGNAQFDVGLSVVRVFESKHGQPEETVRQSRQSQPLVNIKTKAAHANTMDVEMAKEGAEIKDTEKALERKVSKLEDNEKKLRKKMKKLKKERKAWKKEKRLQKEKLIKKEPRSIEGDDGDWV
jgi:hypothetical protein